MKNVLKALVAAVFAVSALSASARGMHKHKPLAFEELPKICQQYFTRAEFQRGNTKFLWQSLPAADLGQRERMCQIAMDSFAEKTRNLHCE